MCLLFYRSCSFGVDCSHQITKEQRHPVNEKEIKLQLWLQLHEGGIKSKTGFCLTLLCILSLTCFLR
jgi:hypothetical protein